jgi:DNA-directed RNA polymerase subunit RPC12/RpoP
MATQVEAYCVKCKQSVDMKAAKKVIMKNNRKATSGKCPYCGTKVFRIG